jgi:hypothetical protein
MDSLVPNSEGLNPTSHKHRKVKDDKIKYSMSQASKDSIILPQIFTKEHLAEIEAGGRDLISPRGQMAKGKKAPKVSQRRFEDEISEIAYGGENNPMLLSSAMMSMGEDKSLLNLSHDQNAFLSELNQRFVQKEREDFNSQKRETEKKQHHLQN